ncbi:MAG: hypothetical protein HXX16_09205 [Bacteroidales bacterium]|nr:hypothetical protein [Bacteroidales bacterium]
MSNLDFQQQQKESLKNNPAISYKELCDILDAFQISSGQGFAIGKTKALLDYIKEGHSFTIESFNNSNEQRVVSSINELVNIYKGIDQFIDLSKDKDFKGYFS